MKRPKKEEEIIVSFSGAFLANASQLDAWCGSGGKAARSPRAFGKKEIIRVFTLVTRASKKLTPPNRASPT